MGKPVITPRQKVKVLEDDGTMTREWYLHQQAVDAALIAAAEAAAAAATADPAALNCVSATVVVGFVYNGNAKSLIEFSGVITLPATPPDSIQIVAISPAGIEYPVQTIEQPVGATVAYAGITSALQPDTTETTWQLVFTAFNSAGAATPSPLTVSSITVVTPVVTAISGTELTAQRWSDPNGALHVVIQATLTVASTQPVNLTLWKTGGAAGNQWLGWFKVTTAGQLVVVGIPTSNMTMLYSPVTSNESWQIKAAPGTYDGSAAIPGTAVASAAFAVNKPATTAASVVTGLYINAITYGVQGEITPFGWDHLYATLHRSAELFAVRFTVQTGHGTGGSFVAGGDHPNEDPINYLDGHFYDIPTNQVVGPGNITVDVPNSLGWKVPTDGNTTHRVRCYAQNQAEAQPGALAWTRQDRWSNGGVGDSSAGTAQYVEFVVDGSKGLPLVGNGLQNSGTTGNTTQVFTVGDNVVTNPGFENSSVAATPWNLSNATLRTDGGHGGANYVRLGTVAFAQVGQRISVQPGQQFAASAWVRSGAGATQADIQFSIYDASNVGLVFINQPLTPPIAAWTRTPLLVGTCPATASYMIFTPCIQEGAPGGTWDVDDAIIVLLSTANTVTSGTTGSNGAVTGTNGNYAQSVIGDPSFEFSNVGALDIGGGSVWTPSDLTSVSIVGTGGNAGPNFAKLTGASSGIQQNSSVVPSQPYYASCFVKSNNPGGTPHSVSLNLVWWTSAGVPISTSSFTASGVIAAWALGPAGFVTSPATAAMVTIQIITNGSEHSGGEWYIDDVNLQPVINQTGNGQTNSSNQTAQSSGYTNSGASSTSTSATSQYGLSYMQILASDGSYVNGNAIASSGGSMTVQGSSGVTASLFASSSGSGIAIVSATSGGVTSSMSYNNFNCRGNSGVTETLAAAIGAARHVVGGIIVP